MTSPRLALAAALLVAGCRTTVAGGPETRPTPDRGRNEPRGGAVAAPADAVRSPIVPPRVALAAGWMPLRSTGVDRFLEAHPTYDGRGVLIGILDTGVDPRAPGLQETSTGRPKVLDVRDYTAEGRVALAPVAKSGDSITIGERRVGGAPRLRAVAVGDAAWYGGELRESTFGPPPAADLNGDGDTTDAFAVVVVRGLGGWIAFLDLDGDGSLGDETPLQDYLASRESFTFARDDARRGHGPVGAVLNLTESGGRPVLDVVIDTEGHGTHVTGVAAGFEIGGQPELHGVAPGAQVLALKISNNARGAISVTGAMVAAMEYAAAFARQRRLPLVLNLSFGVGNSTEGRAVIDSVVDAFVTRHPEIVFSISAGNDGPGLGTVGSPGSADLAISVGAVVPGSFLRLPELGETPPPDELADFSARGGVMAKPDLLAPGVAYSTVPAWNVGEEVKGGTSFAAPHVAGLAALLVSAAAQDIRPWTAWSIRSALMASARRPADAGPLDAGAGVPDVGRAWRHLVSGDVPTVPIVVRAIPMGGNTSHGSAALRRDGLAGAGDTIQLFEVRSGGGAESTAYRLQSDVPWIVVPEPVTAGGDPTTVAVHYRPAAMEGGGRLVGRVAARPLGDATSPPAFELVNTVVFPHALTDGPLEPRRALDAGGIDRHFVRVPDGAGGLEITLALVEGDGEVTLHVFEPSGQPARSDTAPALQIGGRQPVRGVARVRADDLLAGVYEIVVVAAHASPCVYDLRAELSPLTPTVVAGDGMVVVTAPGATVRGSLIGASQTWKVGGAGRIPWRTDIDLPSWAARVEVDVQLPRGQWARFTDLGVTLFTAAGQRIEADPLNYPFGRTRVALGEAVRAGEVVLELFPGLALASDTAAWGAEVTVRALAATAVPLEPGRAQGALAVPADRLPMPAGWVPLVETVAEPLHGPVSLRWTPLVSTHATAGQP